MARTPRVTATEMTRALQRAGWREVRHRGSHAVFRHPSRARLVTVPIHAGGIIKPKTAAAIMEAARLERTLGREVRE